MKLVQDVYYRHLPKAVRKHGLFGQLTGLVNKWLYTGKQREEVKALLIAHCQGLATANVSKAKQTDNQLPATTIPPASTEHHTTGTSQPSTKVEQRTTINTQSSTTVEQRPPVNAQRPTKKARYFSRWKVKRNGRLHIPEPADQPLVEKYNIGEQPAPAGNETLYALNKDTTTSQL